jgi:hypothetical protein
MIHNVFAYIIKEINLHVTLEQLHVFSSSTLQTFKWYVDIVLSKDWGAHFNKHSHCCSTNATFFFVLNTFYTWFLTPAYLLFQAISTHGFAILGGTQVQGQNYQDPHPRDHFYTMADTYSTPLFWNLSCIWLWIMLQIKPLWKIICYQFRTMAK